jgi:hypothetical protein
MSTPVQQGNRHSWCELRPLQAENGASIPLHIPAMGAIRSQYDWASACKVSTGLVLKATLEERME